jgi:hypothetical protein
MSEGKRPGGLTALAVLNFVFGGLGAIGLLFLFSLLGAADKATGGESTRAMTHAGSGMVWFSLLLSMATVALLIVSGVGYLGQKRMLGRTMGNTYAIVSLVSTAIGISVAGFTFMTLIGVVYPVLTLALLNTTFKGDLVN